MSSEKQETIADIVAEMRCGLDKSWHEIDREWARNLPDRIEAATARERLLSKPPENDNSAPVVSTGDNKPGNAAAMREALVAVKKSIDDIGKSSLDCDPTILMAAFTQICARLSARIERALAEPPRNCDVGTVEEQMKRFREFCETEKCGRYRCRSGCKATCIDRCAIDWAQMPYAAQEGAGK